MTPSRSAISVLRFGAGDLNLAVAAEDVTAVAPARPDILHVGNAIAVTPDSDFASQRTIHVQAYQAGDAWPAHAEFRVDCPVEVIICQSRHIVPMAPGISPARWGPIMGFAHIEGLMLLLLDIPSIIRALREQQSPKNQPKEG